jgi:hypothetical protein
MAGVVEAAAVVQEPFDPGFLGTQTIDAYLACLSSGPVRNDPRFAVFGEVPDWSEGRDRYPLPLCEFLIYKALLAYKEDMTKDLESLDKHGVSENYFFFNSAPKGDTQGYGFVIGGTGFIILRGSTSLRDWIDNLTAVPTTYGSKRTLEEIGGAEPERHLGFARAWANVFPQIKAWIDALYPNVTRFCLSGHSLGGALAIVGAYELERWRPGSVAAVVTFAAPSVGGSKFQEKYEGELGLKSRTLRVESREDALGRASPYQPVGNLWEIDKRPMIVGWEKLWAGLLFIAGWEKADSSGQASPPPTTKTEAEKKLDVDARDGTTAGNTGTSEQEPKPQESKGEPKPQDPADNRRGLFGLIAVAVGVIVFLIARKLVITDRAHKAATRYALYFSTLSYQRIRAFRIDPATASEEHYKSASDDLTRHLEYIRGPLSPVYDELKNRPVRALSKKVADRLDADIGRNKAYEGYVW